MPLAPVSNGVALGWFGKLPCAGDFVHRRLPHAVIDTVDTFLQQGLGEVRARDPQHWRQAFDAAPIWNFAIPAAATSTGLTLIGLLAPSRDRVGREFPLCAGIALPRGVSAAPWLDGSHEWLSELGRVVGEACARGTSVEAFDRAVQAVPLPHPRGAPAGGGAGDDILSIINGEPLDIPTVPMPLAHVLPWPELPLQFDPDATTSYWWTNRGNGGPLRGFTTDAGLTPSLLATLLRPVVPSPRG